jgi:hypothetical protein
MTDELISLAERRAAREDNCHLWEPLDCAKALVRDIENGTIKPKNFVILFVEEGSDQLEGWYCKVNSIDIMVMLWGKLWRVTQRQWPGEN